MTGFLGETEVLTRERVKDILINKQYSYLEQKVTLLGVEDGNFVLKIFFLIEYRQKMISIEEKERILIPISDFHVEDWGDGIRKVADID